MHDYETHPLTWRGIALEVRYCPEWSPSYRGHFGYALAHLEIEADGQPLPMTETGYRSHFDRADNIEARGGPVAFVLAWLEAEGSSRNGTKPSSSASS